MVPSACHLTAASACLRITPPAAIKRLLWTVLVAAGLFPGLAVAQGRQCANYQPNKQPFFGELHLHSYSNA
jgi:hypothetical protein